MGVVEGAPDVAVGVARERVQVHAHRAGEQHRVLKLREKDLTPAEAVFAVNMSIIFWKKVVPVIFIDIF